MTDTDFFIDSNKRLAAFVQSNATESILSLDTEFVRERTYYPQLCLIQIATPDQTVCVDCLAEIDLDPLFAFLLDPERTWLLHSARQDLEVIEQRSGRLPDRLIDTQIAAGLLGRAPQVGLQELLAELLGVNLDKAYTRTNWAKRPLPAPAIDYALDDVRYLAPLWECLKRELETQGRMEWFENDCKASVSLPLLTPTVTLWSRLRGINSLGVNDQCAALALIEWRENCAQELDRPRRWVMSDELLVRATKVHPTSQQELTSITEMPARLAERFGADMLAALESCNGPEKLEFVRGQLGGERPDRQELKQLQDRAKTRAQELGIQTEILATRKELGELLIGSPSERIARGWRWNELKALV